MESGESGKLSLKFVGFVGFARAPDELNSTAVFENLPLRRSEKMTLGTHGQGLDSRVNGKIIWEQACGFLGRIKC